MLAIFFNKYLFACSVAQNTRLLFILANYYEHSKNFTLQATTLSCFGPFKNYNHTKFRLRKLSRTHIVSVNIHIYFRDSQSHVSLKEITEGRFPDKMNAHHYTCRFIKLGLCRSLNISQNHFLQPFRHLLF